MSQPTALVSHVINKFRKLNPDQLRTIIALSGGADSIALMFCLSRLKNVRLLAVHVTHDLRPTEQTELDYEIAKAAATKCGVDFLRIRGPVVNGCKYGNYSGSPSEDDETNLEAMARHVRYQILHRQLDRNISSRAGQNFIRWDNIINRSRGCIATAHHADDQIETMLMRIGRGTGIGGLRCIHESSKGVFDQHHRIIRPMLGLTRTEAEEICKVNDLPWTTDLTNADRSFTRNRIRHDVVPVLRELFPKVAEHATFLAMIAADTQKLIERKAADDIRLDYDNYLPEGLVTCFADSLRMQEDVVIQHWIIEHVTRGYGSKGLDKINYHMIEDVINAVRKYQTKTFLWPGRTIVVSQSRLTIRKPTREESEGLQVKAVESTI